MGAKSVKPQVRSEFDGAKEESEAIVGVQRSVV